NTPDVSLTSGSRSSEYPIVVELDLQLQNFSDVDSLNGHQVTIELIGVTGTAVETIKVLHDVIITPHYNVGLTDVFTVGPEDAGVVKYDKVRLKIRGVARSDSFDIHVRNLTFKQFETKTTVNDKGVFLAVSPDIIRTMSGGGSSVVFDGGGGTGPSVTDWDNIQNNPFSNNTPSDFASQGSLPKSLAVGDVRYGDFPNSDGTSTYMPAPNDPVLSQSVTPIFSQDWGGPGYGGILTVKGWNNTYAGWQIAGTANNGPSDQWFLRSGGGT